MKLRRDAAIEGLAAGSLKLSAGVVAISITGMAAGPHAGTGAIQLGISLTSLVAFLAIRWKVRQLRRGDPEQRPSAGSVLWSFLLVAVGLAGIASAPSAVFVAVSLALMGVPIATNARFRYTAMARYAGQEGTFQKVSNRWSRFASVGGLLIAGVLSALTPLGWRWTAVVAAGWFVLVAFVVYRARAGSTESSERLTYISG